ncbi:MAG: 23S rRNA (adenine(2503)-C(2))-methyltransferase RlmN [Bacillota bacterium]
MTLEEMGQLVKELGQPGYRAGQLYRWVHRHGASGWAEMKNLPQELRQELLHRCLLNNTRIVEQVWSAGKDTAKCLVELPDGEKIEAVLMIYEGPARKNRYTACVSTQVGCPMGCSFCATGLTGWQRNLTAGEIVGQALAMQTLFSPPRPVTNIVFMGMGEPLLNYQNVVRAIHLFNSPEGMNISMRRITVSTCGLVPQIRQLADEGLPVVLAVSLHAPSDALREELMPVNKKYPIAQLLTACRYYAEKTGRRVTFEYALIRGVNDRPEHVEQLCRLLKGLLCNVNLIPFNLVVEKGWQRPSQGETGLFVKRLQSCGIETVVRESKGHDIEAACGQLRRRHYQKG